MLGLMSNEMLSSLMHNPACGYDMIHGNEHINLCVKSDISLSSRLTTFSCISHAVANNLSMSLFQTSYEYP